MPQLKKSLATIIPFSLSMMASSTVFAGPPVPYDNWSVSNGAIDTSTSCGAAGVTCKTIATDNGFIYEEVKTDVYTFLRLILSEEDASGNPVDLSFTNETYTPFAIVNRGIAQGAATKQVVRDAASEFELISEVQKGNMRGLLATTAEEMFTTKIDQSFAKGVVDAEFSSGFKFTNYTNFMAAQATNPDTNIERGRILEITQDVLVGEPGDATKKQEFVHSQTKGYAGNSSSTFNFAPDAGVLPVEFMVGGLYNTGANSPITQAGSMTMPNTVNGGIVPGTTTVGYGDGDDISTTWIGQSSNVNDIDTDLLYQRVANNTDGVEATAVVIPFLVSGGIIPGNPGPLPAPINPFDWDTTNFGTAPQL